MKYSLFKFGFLVILYSCICVGIYSNSLHGPFLFDDIPHITEAPSIQISRIDFESLKKAANSAEGRRAVPRLTFALNYFFDQYNSFGYHLVNVIVHILNGIILFYLFEMTLVKAGFRPDCNQASDLRKGKIGSGKIAFFATLLWVVNPLHTQSVSYIVQRMNSMAAMFCLLSLLLYICGRNIQLNLDNCSKTFFHEDKNENNQICLKLLNSWFSPCLLWYAGSLMFWGLAVNCKENAAILPAIMFLYEWCFFQDANSTWLKKRIKIIAGIFALLVLLTIIATGLKPIEKFSSIQDFANGQFTYIERILTQPRVILYYIFLLFFPHPKRLNFDYDFPLSHSLTDPWSTGVSIFAIIIILFISIISIKKERLLSFCILWYFITLSVESSIIPLGIIFEHRTYLPSMFISLIVVMFIFRFISPLWISNVIIITAIIISGFWTYERNFIWSDEVIFWRNSSEKSPKKARPISNLGCALVKQGKVEEGIAYFNKALEINPNHVKAHNNLGQALEKIGKLDDAISHYKVAVELKPGYKKAQKNLASAFEKKNIIDEAIKTLSNVLQISPDFEEAHNHLGVLYLRKNNKIASQYHFEKAVLINPNYAVGFFNLGNLYVEQGKFQQAFNCFEKALQIDPNFAEVHCKLGNIHLKQHNIDNAIQHYNKALQQDPELAEVYYGMGFAMEKSNRRDEAIQYLKTALKINSELGEVHYILANLLNENGELTKAKEHYHEALRINPGHAEACNNLALTLEKQGRFYEALSFYYKAVESNPNFSEALNNLGLLLMSQEQLGEAYQYIQKALESDPEFAEAHNSMGALLLNKGNIEKAIKHFRAALQIRPDYESAKKNLKKANENKEKYQRAIEMLAMKLGTSLSDPDLYYRFGKLCQSQGNLNMAIRSYQQTLAIQPNHIRTLNRMAGLHAGKDDYVQAIYFYERMIGIRADLKSAYYNIACLYAKQNETELSLDWLEKALDKGYKNWEQIHNDNDLQATRKTVRFKKIAAKIEGQFE